HHIFYNEFRVDSEEHPVLLTEPQMNPKSNREKMITIMFETFNVPAMYVQLQTVLSFYSTRRSTGIALEVGDGVSSVIPMIECYSILHVSISIDIGGRDLNEYLERLLIELLSGGSTMFNGISERMKDAQYPLILLLVKESHWNCRCLLFFCCKMHAIS
ncbi:MAG: putative Actin, partial [Streblomastix strix]